MADLRLLKNWNFSSSIISLTPTPTLPRCGRCAPCRGGGQLGAAIQIYVNNRNLEQVLDGWPRPALQADYDNHRVRLGAPFRPCHPRKDCFAPAGKRATPPRPRRGRRTLTLTMGQGPPYRRIATTIGCASAHRFGLAIRGKIALHRRENGRPHPAHGEGAGL